MRPDHSLIIVCVHARVLGVEQEILVVPLT